MLESSLERLALELITPVGVYGLFCYLQFMRGAIKAGVRTGIPEDGVPELHRRSDWNAWSYSYAQSAYKTQVCVELSDGLVDKFFSSDASVLGTANRMVHHAVESSKAMRLHNGESLNPVLVNETVKHAVHRLRAMQLSRGADTGVARRPTVSPFA